MLCFFEFNSFGHRVGDVVPQIGQQIVQMTPEQLRHFRRWLESASVHPSKPIFEESPRPAFFLILPELREQFLGSLGPRHFQVQVLQRGEIRRLFQVEILRIIQPQLPRAFEYFVALPEKPFLKVSTLKASSFLHFSPCSNH
jgi:hypothetical protein